MKTENENLQSKEIISESVISRNEVQSLRNKSQEVISEMTASRNEFESLKNKSKVHRDKSQVLEEKLHLLGDMSLLARNKIHDVKEETYVFKNRSLLVKHKLHMIRKEALLLKNKLLLSRNKIHDVKKETEVFKDESEKRKKVQINRFNVKSNAKSNDSTKISKLQKLRDDAKQYEDKAKRYKAKPYSNKSKQYGAKAKKNRDEILKLVQTSKEPSKPCIDTSKIMNTDKALKVTDNNDSIDEKENQVAICNNTNDSSNDCSNDTKPNTDEKTFQCIQLINELIEVSMIGKKEKPLGPSGNLMYQNYVKNGYGLEVIMHIQGLKSSVHVLVKYFLLMSIKQCFQKVRN